MKDLFAILAKTLRWTFAISAVVFVVTFIGPLLIGGPGAHRQPV